MNEVRFMMEVARRMRWARQKRGLTQREVARRTFISPTAYIAYEKGRVSPSITYVMQLCEALGCSIETFIGAQWHDADRALSTELAGLGLDAEAIAAMEDHREMIPALSRMIKHKDFWNMLERMCGGR